MPAAFLDELKAGGVEIAGLPMCIGGEGPNPAGYQAKLEGGVARGKPHQIKLTPKKKAAKLAWFFEVSKNITFKISCSGGTGIRLLSVSSPSPRLPVSPSPPAGSPFFCPVLFDVHRLRASTSAIPRAGGRVGGCG